MHFKFIVVGLASVSVGVLGSNEWRRPEAGDRRSPCPMVNSLANHGYLPRDGLNISMEQLVAGFTAGVNLAADATELVGRQALKASTTGRNDTFDLDDLSRHGFIEHDGSLSRNDIYFGDNHSFNQTIWDSVAAHFTGDTISIATAAKARAARLASAAAANPQFNMTSGDKQASLLESALLQVVFGDLVVGNAKTEWVKILFQEERLPIEEGFKRSSIPLTTVGILAMTGLVGAASI